MDEGICTKERGRREMLDLDAPLLSTRRLGGVACRRSDVEPGGWTDATRQVPFLWERVPGKPKDADRCVYVEETMPPPKPPPCRWKDVNNSNEDGNEDDDDMFLDAIDRISLSESLDIQCRSSRMSGLDGLESLDSKVAESCGDHHHQSPNFIMSRFLPAATALATSSVMDGSKKKQPMQSNHRRSKASKHAGEYGPHRSIRAHSPTKACGLMPFFPWNLKNAVSGFKSPIPSCSPRRLKLKSDARRMDVVRGGGKRCRRDDGL